MSHSKKHQTDASDDRTHAGAKVGGIGCGGPSAWVAQAEEFARKEPGKAVASAVGAGFLLNVLPVRAILGALGTVAFVLVRPALLFLGLLKAWEICPCKKEPKI